jgi:hypothetical protein
MQGDDAVVGLQLRELTRSKSSFARCSDTSVGGAGVVVCEGSEEDDEDEGDKEDKEDKEDEGDEGGERDEEDEGDEGDEEY